MLSRPPLRVYVVVVVAVEVSCRLLLSASDDDDVSSLFFFPLFILPSPAAWEGGEGAAGIEK